MAPELTADSKLQSLFRAAGSGQNLMGQNLLGLTRGELEQFAVSCGQPRFRGTQLYLGIYNRRERDFARLTDLGRGLRNSSLRVTRPLIRQSSASSCRATDR